MISLIDVWQISDKIVIVISIVSFLLGLLKLFSSFFESRKIKQIADASYIRTKSGLRAFVKQYKRYQPHIIIENNPQSKMEYRRFVRRISDEPLVFIFGESGSGKSMLLQHLACSFRKTLLHPNRDSLYGVFAKPQQTLDDYLIALKSDISTLNAKRIYIFLDGFDELREINKGSDVNDLLLKVRGLFDNHFPGKFFCLVVTSRIEVFNHITKPEELGFSVFRLQKLSKHQIICLYKKSTGKSIVNSFNNRRLVRSKNIRRLKVFIGYSSKTQSETSSTIFGIPFIVQYVDILFSACSDIELKNANQYEIYRIIVHDYWLEHEYAAYSKIEADLTKRIPKEVYKDKSKEFIQSIIAVIYNKKTSFINYGDIPFPDMPYIGRQCLISRNLLILIDDGLYTFIHHSIYEFFIAEFMATSTLAHADCMYYLYSNNHEQLLQLFCGAIYDNKILLNSILTVIDYTDCISYAIWNDIFMSSEVIASNSPHCMTMDLLTMYLPYLTKFGLATLNCTEKMR